MAVQIPQPLFAVTQLTTANTTLYTAPSTPASLVVSNVRVRFTNVTTVAHAVTAYAVPLAGAAGATNEVLNAESIPGNAHLDVDMPALAPGSFYVASADAITCINASVLSAVIFS